MTHSHAQPRDKSNTFTVITIKNITWGRSNKFQDTSFENNKTFEFRRVESKIVPFNNCRRKERVFEVVSNL